MNAVSTRESLAFGLPSDVTACARVFADVEEAMTEARRLAGEFTGLGDDIWAGPTAELVRGQMVDLPDLLLNFAEANHAVANALDTFGPQLEGYLDASSNLRRQADDVERDLASTEASRDTAVDRVAADQGGLAGLIPGVLDPSTDPEVAALDDRLRELRDRLDALERRHDSIDEEFETQVAAAVDRIRDADGVLYDSAWDEFWSQTLEPLLDTLRGFLNIAMIVLMAASIIFGVGALIATIVAVMLFAISVIEIAGSLAAGDGVTGEMLLNLAIDGAAFATLGAARTVKNLEMAGKASRAGARNAMRFGSRTKHVKRMQEYAAATKKFRTAEKFEGAIDFVDAGVSFSQGDIVGGLASGAKGGVDLRGMSTKGSNAVRGIHAGIGVAGDHIGADTGAAAATDPPESPRDWPGLEGLGDPQ